MSDSGVRLRKPNRGQAEICVAALDDLLDPEHWVRLVWRYIQKMDMSAFHADIKAVGSQPGRDATDPRILLCLWGSAARADLRLCANATWCSGGFAAE